MAKAHGPASLGGSLLFMVLRSTSSPSHCLDCVAVWGPCYNQARTLVTDNVGDLDLAASSA